MLSSQALNFHPLLLKLEYSIKAFCPRLVVSRFIFWIWWTSLSQHPDYKIYHPHSPSFFISYKMFVVFSSSVFSSSWTGTVQSAAVRKRTNWQGKCCTSIWTPRYRCTLSLKKIFELLTEYFRIQRLDIWIRIFKRNWLSSLIFPWIWSVYFWYFSFNLLFAPGDGKAIQIYDGRRSPLEGNNHTAPASSEKLQTSDSSGKGEIIYFRDSDDEMPDSDEDPDDDLDI